MRGSFRAITVALPAGDAPPVDLLPFLLDPLVQIVRVRVVAAIRMVPAID